jgi:hypothetical protein
MNIFVDLNCNVLIFEFFFITKRWIHGKRAKIAFNIIGWVETLRMHVFELKSQIHILIT